MSEVKRYRLGRNRDFVPCMTEVRDGQFIRIPEDEFVRARDYDALKAENARLRGEAAEHLEENRYVFNSEQECDDAWRRLKRAAPVEREAGRCLNPEYCVRSSDGECYPCDHEERDTGL